MKNEYHNHVNSEEKEINKDKETIKITFDMITGVMTYSGPKEDGEELLKMLKDAGAGFEVYKKFTPKMNEGVEQ